MNIEVNYKNKKRYNTAKYPLRQGFFWTWLIWILSRIMLIGKNYRIEKINMEGLKPPYLLLSNHMHFIDFELAALATYPHPINNVVSIDGYVVKFWLMEWIGAIATRKFTNDLHLVKSIRKVLKRGDVLAMYPEARYSPSGTTAFLPDSLGKLVKMNMVPVVTVVHHGNHLYAPFWNFRSKRHVPFYTTITKLLTPDQIQEMSVDEINQTLREGLFYDDYRYQKENGIREAVAHYATASFMSGKPCFVTSSVVFSDAFSPSEHTVPPNIRLRPRKMRVFCQCVTRIICNDAKSKLHG